MMFNTFSAAASVGLHSMSTLVQLFIFLTSSLQCGAMTFSVDLIAPRYVYAGGSALLQCRHSVRADQLHRVEWLRGNRKMFQFVRGRTPPFRNYSTPGAELDWSRSNESQILLRNLDFDATGIYSCVVSTETPIYTKPSNDEELTVIEIQRQEPVVSVRKSSYVVGETLEANCTTSPSRPPAHVTWFVNDNTADSSEVKNFPGHRHRDKDHATSVTVQLSFEVAVIHFGTSGQLKLTCLSTIPGYLGPDPDDSKYMDKRNNSITVDIELPPPVNGCQLSTGVSTSLLFFLGMCSWCWNL